MQAFNPTPAGTHLALVHYSWNDSRTSPLYTFSDTQSVDSQMNLLNSFNGQIPFYMGISDLALYVIVAPFLCQLISVASTARTHLYSLSGERMRVRLQSSLEMERMFFYLKK